MLRNRVATWPFATLTIWLVSLLFQTSIVFGMNADEIASLRQDTRKLFYHGYNNYMTHAFPEDELRPISCKPQTRNRENPADIGLNDVLGNYSLTLIDSLSTLAILASEEGRDGRKSLRDFKNGIKALVDLYGSGDAKNPCGSKSCGFDLDSKVQVFETNIRGVGGLLSAHLFAIGALPIKNYSPEWVSMDGEEVIDWVNFRYDGQLLRLAHDLAVRLLPAFDTPTGLPYPRVNLRHGASFYHDSDEAMCRPDGSSVGNKEATETCAAGAGSLVLEFSTLSRLVGDDRFENLAKKAFWAVWQRRSSIGLVGNGIDAESGQWVVPSLAGIGAGIDSFYEYALKSSILLSGLPYDANTSLVHAPEAFLNTWQQVHAAVKHHVLRSKHAEKHPFYGQSDQFTGAPRYAWVDNLSAYYPGLLTLAGEVDEAIESHLLFTALWTRYAALPERWIVYNANIDSNFKHWSGRPEFIESTFYLYQATKDPFYLHTGEMTLRDIRRRCWTRCGWADLGDVISGEKRDRMESFFLGETAKYLYLLFDEQHPLNKLDAPMVFTTEGHPLIIPAEARNHQRRSESAVKLTTEQPEIEATSCPAPSQSLPLTQSNLVNRSDFFHAAVLAQLHLVPVQPARESALLAASDENPGISLADIRSPTNYTFYPWTLPRSLVPLNGWSAAIRNPTVSTLTFPNLSPIAAEGELPTVVSQAVHKFLDGILVSSLSNLRLNMVQEPKSLLIPTKDGDRIEINVGQQYRVHGVANWALGKDEKVVLTREALDGIAPGDPNFRRIKDLEMIDIILDFADQQPPQPLSDVEVTPQTSADVGKKANSSISSIIDDIEAMFVTLLSDETQSNQASASLTTDTKMLRTIVPAILPTGLGAAPLPGSIDRQDFTLATPGKLPFSSIYFLDDTLCAPRQLPINVAKTNQLLFVRRGGCSFNEKLSRIPSFPPASAALQAVIILSPEDYMGSETTSTRWSMNGGERMIRPLLDEKQTTSSGFERRHGIPMAMIDGTDEVVAAIKAAASTIAYFDKSGKLQEEHWEHTGAGIGIKRRYWFESMGIPIGNLVAL